MDSKECMSKGGAWMKYGNEPAQCVYAATPDKKKKKKKAKGNKIDSLKIKL